MGEGVGTCRGARVQARSSPRCPTECSRPCRSWSSPPRASCSASGESLCRHGLSRRPSAGGSAPAPGLRMGSLCSGLSATSAIVVSKLRTPKLQVSAGICAPLPGRCPRRPPPPPGCLWAGPCTPGCGHPCLTWPPGRCRHRAPAAAAPRPCGPAPASSAPRDISATKSSVCDRLITW